MLYLVTYKCFGNLCQVVVEASSVEEAKTKATYIDRVFNSFFTKAERLYINKLITM